MRVYVTDGSETGSLGAASRLGCCCHVRPPMTPISPDTSSHRYCVVSAHDSSRLLTAPHAHGPQSATIARHFCPSDGPCSLCLRCSRSLRYVQNNCIVASPSTSLTRCGGFTSNGLTYHHAYSFNIALYPSLSIVGCPVTRVILYRNYCMVWFLSLKFCFSAYSLRL